MMRQAIGTTCLTIMLAVVMLTASVPSYAAPAEYVEVRIKVTRNANGTVEIEAEEKDKRFVGLCKSGTNSGTKKKKQCDGDQFKWTLKKNTLLADETLEIRNAPGRRGCFNDGKSPVATFTPSSNDESRYSGEAVESCALDKYGTYWPYIVTLTLANGTTYSTDPGGIIHP